VVKTIKPVQRKNAALVIDVKEAVAASWQSRFPGALQAEGVAMLNKTNHHFETTNRVPGRGHPDGADETGLLHGRRPGADVLNFMTEARRQGVPELSPSSPDQPCRREVLSGRKTVNNLVAGAVWYKICLQPRTRPS